MISLVLYGRNDSYGYNLHKRAAISLNCMAEVLTDPADEIIFVDYNTPDDFPTFPEAIQDTLTEKAKSLLRIFRVRPKHHDRFRRHTHLACLEPIARNVGIRRSNTRNRWVLSTNTDMVFVPRGRKSLSEIAESLPDAYYHLPRFEVPETLWESADRLDPRGTIESFRRWGTEFHLNEIVYTSHADVKYDGPGDFQLALRSDFWRINGFDESMLLGWHVDSNIAKRLSLLPRQLGDVVDHLYGYHCDHTRQVTPAHRPSAMQNDQKVYYDNVAAAAVRRQAESWGLADVEIEELSVDATSRGYVIGLHDAIEQPLERPTTTGYSPTSFNRIDYSSSHVVPFVADALASYPRATIVAWSGAKKSLLTGFAEAWRAMGFSEPIRVFSECTWLGPSLPAGCGWMPWEDACAQADVFVFDWGKSEDGIPFEQWVFERDPVIRQVTRHFRRAIREERRRLSDGAEAARRFIGVNAICNAAEGIFSGTIGAALTPLATHIRQGFLKAENNEILGSLYIGQAGHRRNDGIATLPGATGCVFYGPYLDMDNGVYRLSLEFSSARRTSSGAFSVGLQVRSGSQLLACRQIEAREITKGRVSLDFVIPLEVSEAADWPRIEFLLDTSGGIEFVVTRARLEQIDAPRNVAALRDLQIAPLLITGPAGKRERFGISARRNVAELVAYGPYFWLPAGHYEAKLRFRAASSPEVSIRAYAAYHLGMDVLGRTAVSPKRKGIVTCTIPFDITDEAPLPEEGLLEFNVRSTGNRTFSLLSLSLKRRGPARAATTEDADRGIIPWVERLHAGRWFQGAILAAGGVNGPVFRSPRLPLPAGGQRLQLSLRSLDRVRSGTEGSGLTVFALSGGQIFGRREITRRELRRGAAAFDFAVPQGAWGREVEVMLYTSGLFETEISSALLTECDGLVPPIDLSEVDLLKLLQPGPKGAWSPAPMRACVPSLHADRAKPEIVAFGPQIALDAGSFEFLFDVIAPAGASVSALSVDVFREGHEAPIGKLLVKLAPPKRSIAVNRAWQHLRGAAAFSASADGRYGFHVWSSPRSEYHIIGVRLAKTLEPLGLRRNGRAFAEPKPNGLQRTSPVAR